MMRVGNGDENPAIVIMLTHLPLDKKADISQKIFRDAYLWMKISYFDKKKSLKFVPKGPTDNYPPLV